MQCPAVSYGMLFYPYTTPNTFTMLYHCITSNSWMVPERRTDRHREAATDFQNPRSDTGANPGTVELHGVRAVRQSGAQVSDGAGG